MKAQFKHLTHHFRMISILLGIFLSLTFSFSTLPVLSLDLDNLDPKSGGETTVENRTSLGYSQPAANLSDLEIEGHQAGDDAFEATFVTSPAPVNARLAKQFNNFSCAACHTHDGRGTPTIGNLLVRVSLPPSNDKLRGEALASSGNTPPVPNLGNQIQDQAIYGVKPEATVEINWDELSAIYADGTFYQLRSPRLKITLANGKPLPSNVLTSARVPPPVFGRGLLEAIPEQAIVNLADPNDKNGDGISGKPNRVWDITKKTLVLGRFGLKSNQPNLFQQNAAAYFADLGLTNPLYPAQDGTSEIDLETLMANTFYTQTLAVPNRTGLDDPVVKTGEKLFGQANCIACHITTMKTGEHPIKALANQTIHAYTDLLLHDMGKGLADGRPDFEANGNEWRTPPLWGLGLSQTVLPYSGYLHDGRARSLEEAILWHGGEAEKSKETFRAMTKNERTALIQFLNTL